MPGEKAKGAGHNAQMVPALKSIAFMGIISVSYLPRMHDESMRQREQKKADAAEHVRA